MATASASEVATDAETRGQLGPLLAVAAVVVALDQLTKWWAVEALADGDIDLFWTLRFNLHYNRGTAFSLLTSLGPLIGVLAFIVVLALAAMGRKVVHRPTALLLGALMGGALGNLLDRVFRSGDGLLGGAVVDFIDFQWWPIFNVADMAIVLAGFALVAMSWATRPPPP